MSLDKISLHYIDPLLSNASVLCLGVPDMPVGEGNFKNYALAAGAKCVDAVDVIAHEGWERIVDLNVAENWANDYDLVINPGTLEHCFNIGQAWANAWNAVALHGHLLSIVPVSMLNHGYWNVSPIAFGDWCKYNGGAIRGSEFAMNGKPTAQPKIRAISGSRSGRGFLPPETVGYFLLQKMVRIEPR